MPVPTYEKRLFDMMTGKEWGLVRVVDDPNSPGGLSIEIRRVGENSVWKRFLAMTIVDGKLYYNIT